MSQKENLKFVFALVTSLFFLWGISYGLLDTMNKNFQEQLGITKAGSGMLQFVYFGAYFVIGLPAGYAISKWGYKVGIIIGLSLFAIGALLFVPASYISKFAFFLFSFFVLASGVTFLETAANPYATMLGDPKTADRRINFSQTFNGLGQSIGPHIGAFILSVGAAGSVSNMETIRIVYVVIAAVVFFLILTFLFTKMPNRRESSEGKIVQEKNTENMWAVANFRNGVLAQTLYVAAQVGVQAFFINYAVEHWEGLSSAQGASLLGIGLFLFLLGRAFTTVFLTWLKAEKIIALYSIINVLLLLTVVFGMGKASVWAMVITLFFMSVMFPSIFSLSIRELDSNTAKVASSFLVMAVAGGAVFPPIMGLIADHYGISAGYIVPLFCFLYLAWYGATYKRA